MECNVLYFHISLSNLQIFLISFAAVDAEALTLVPV